MSYVACEEPFTMNRFQSPPSIELLLSPGILQVAIKKVTTIPLSHDWMHNKPVLYSVQSYTKLYNTTRSNACTLIQPGNVTITLPHSCWSNVFHCYCFWHRCCAVCADCFYNNINHSNTIAWLSVPPVEMITHEEKFCYQLWFNRSWKVIDFSSETEAKLANTGNQRYWSEQEGVNKTLFRLSDFLPLCW